MAQQPSSSSNPPILVPVTPNQQQSKQQQQQQQQPVTASSSSKPTKKIPPLPWTHLETVNLIEVYQEKWYSLKRGQLKASQWDQVAITVASRCGFEQPSKTSTQCRHKMEKLRKRYRSEKQRLSSSWAYFVLMDHMEKGPFPLSVRPISSVQPNRRNLDPPPPPPPPPPPIVDEEEDEDDDDDDDDDEEDEEDDNDNLPDSTNKSRSINHILRRPPIVNRIVEKPKPASSSSFAPRQCSSRVDDVDLGVSRFSRNPNFPKRKFPFQIDEEDEENDEEEGVGVGVGGGVGGGGGGEPLMELASVIRSFGEGFVKIEQMKMEMMKETERYRMEMETKRTEMILESQHRIVDAIAKVLCSQKKAKKMQEM